jgi:predicted O-methyltransferase YrrM
MKNIIFLINSNSSFYVIIFYFFNKLLNIFLKRRIIKFKRQHELVLCDKKITNDYFSSKAYYFYHYLSKLESNFKYLEIGSYEGNSALLVSNLFIRSQIHCVDNWVGTAEYNNHNFLKIEENFDYNTRNKNNILKTKNTSDNFFNQNKIIFDAIYIDGYHFAPQVYNDCNNAWKYLKKNGILICDDYIWNGYSKISENPCYAINKFLKEIKNSYRLLYVSNYQIFIKKIL